MSQLLVTLVVILFPGILSAIIYDKITTHSKWDSFKFSLYSLVLGIFSYSFLQAIYLVSDIVKSLDLPETWTWLSIWQHALEPNGSINASEIFGAAIVSLPVALASSYIINHKLFNKLAGLLRVSQKFGDENLFSYYLNSKDVDWIYVRDQEDDITYQGRIVSFSEGEHCQELVLTEVSVFQTTDSKLLYEIPSIYICKKFGSFIIESIPNELME